MNLEFHKLHDQNARLFNDKILPGRESVMATNAKNINTNKINFFSRMPWNDCWKFFMKHYWDLGVQNYRYQNEKKPIAELGHSDLFTIYFDL